MKITHKILKEYARANIPCTISFGGYIIQCILYYEKPHINERIFVLSYDTRLCGAHPENNNTEYPNSRIVSSTHTPYELDDHAVKFIKFEISKYFIGSLC